jgi:GDPmannose 4,6-dehydratase
MHLMLQQDEPGDYVIGTGVMHSVRDAVRIAFDAADLNWEDYVYIDPALVRPAEVETLCADSSMARAALNWAPSVSFEELMRMMVESDLRQVARERDYGDLLLTSSW